MIPGGSEPRRTDRALIVLVKLPVPGAVKTRLCPPLSAPEAAALYRGLVEDLVEALDGAHPWDLWLVHAPEDPPAAVAAWLGGTRRLLPQRGADLGARLDDALARAFASGYAAALVAGSDVPGLTPAAVTGAFTALERDELVIAPADDGGYSLLGLRRPCPALFAGVPWSTPRVLEATLARARAAGLGVRRLDPLPDLDTAEDARRWREWLARRPEDRARLPRTAAQLDALFDR